jgi:DNA-binding transcriptional ArsR family regulator
MVTHCVIWFMRRDVFQAIADPKRRAIIQLLALQTMTVSAVAEHFKVSRPAISKHLKILTECGLIRVTQEGRERYCQAQFNKLHEVSDWVEHYKKFWTERFDRLEEYLEELQSTDKKHGNKKRNG